MEIQNNQGESIKEFYSRDCVDTAELCFFILQPDVTPIHHKDDFKIQAKLKSIGEEDMNSNGEGVTRSSFLLYNVSEAIKEKKDQNKKKVTTVKEPKDRKLVEFYLN